MRVFIANVAGGCLSHCLLITALALDYTATATTSYHVSYHGCSFDTVQFTERHPV